MKAHFADESDGINPIRPESLDQSLISRCKNLKIASESSHNVLISLGIIIMSLPP